MSCVHPSSAEGLLMVGRHSLQVNETQLQLGESWIQGSFFEPADLPSLEKPVETVVDWKQQWFIQHFWQYFQLYFNDLLF